MEYKTYIPTKLGGIIECVWEMEIQDRGTFTIMPEGKVELLFPLWNDIDVTATKISPVENPMRNHICFLSGLHTKPLKTKFRKFHTFGVQMRPIAVKAIFGMPLCEIKNYFVEGGALLDNIRIMEDQLNSKKSFKERAQWFENFLLELISDTPALHMAIRLDQMLCTYTLPKDGSKKSIHDLLGYSRTQTFRLFNTWFCTSSHSYLKLLQFIRSVESLHEPTTKLGEVALSNGYFDQAHFNRTFREFSDITPGHYRKLMSDKPVYLFS